MTKHYPHRQAWWSDLPFIGGATSSLSDSHKRGLDGIITPNLGHKNGHEIVLSCDISAPLTVSTNLRARRLYPLRTEHGWYSGTTSRADLAPIYRRNHGSKLLQLLEEESKIQWHALATTTRGSTESPWSIRPLQELWCPTRWQTPRAERKVARGRLRFVRNARQTAQEKMGHASHHLYGGYGFYEMEIMSKSSTLARAPSSLHTGNTDMGRQPKHRAPCSTGCRSSGAYPSRPKGSIAPSSNQAQS